MIIRRHITSNFTIIPNEAILDARLSISARWLLAYLLSRPNDWKVQVGDIQKKGGIGREKAYRLIKELIEVGWVRKDFSRGEGGQWGGIDYVVMDQLEAGECSTLESAEKPYTVKPNTENHHLTKDLKKPSTDKIQNTEVDISYDASFDEFWAAYPKRPGNPKKPAKLKYTAARKRGVSHETIMAGVNAYAQTRANEDPKFTKLAETWLNKECWETDCSPPDDKPALDTEAGGKWLDELLAVYPGHVGDRADAAKLIAVEMSRGVNGKDLWDAARKYKLWCVGPPYENRKTVPAMLETWLKFKWREMEGYEFCQVGPDRINTVRPKKVK